MLPILRKAPRYYHHQQQLSNNLRSQFSNHPLVITKLNSSSLSSLSPVGSSSCCWWQQFSIIIAPQQRRASFLTTTSLSSLSGGKVQQQPLLGSSILQKQQQQQQQQHPKKITRNKHRQRQRRLELQNHPTSVFKTAAVSFSTEAADRDDSEASNDRKDNNTVTMTAPPSKETVSYKDEIIKGFIKDLSKVREDAFTVLEEEEEEEEIDDDDEAEIIDGEGLFALGTATETTTSSRSLRNRFEIALSQKRYERRQQKRQKESFLTKSSSYSYSSSFEWDYDATTSLSADDDNFFSWDNATTTVCQEEVNHQQSACHQQKESSSSPSSSSPLQSYTTTNDNEAFSTSSGDLTFGGGLFESRLQDDDDDDDDLLTTRDPWYSSTTIVDSRKEKEEEENDSHSVLEIGDNDDFSFSSMTDVGTSAANTTTTTPQSSDTVNNTKVFVDDIGSRDKGNMSADDTFLDDDVDGGDKPKEEEGGGGHHDDYLFLDDSEGGFGMDDLPSDTSNDGTQNDQFFFTNTAATTGAKGDSLTLSDPWDTPLSASSSLNWEDDVDDDRGWEMKKENQDDGDYELDEIQLELEKVCVLLEKTTKDDWMVLDDDSDVDEEIDSIDGSQCLDDDDDDDDDDEMAAKDTIDDEIDISHDEPTQIDPLDEEELTQIEQFRSIIDASLFESKSLTTDECNLILARLATAPELSLDVILYNLLEVYHLMTKYVAPDETTYKILLLTLDRRIGAGGTSSDSAMVNLLQDMIHFNVKLSSDRLLSLGMECLNRENNWRVAKSLIMEYALDDKEREFRIPRQATRTLMKMFTRENRPEDAVSLLEKCMKENGRDNSGDTDAVLDAALRWPDRNRAGHRRDITHILHSFLEVVMRDSPDYRPGFSAYRNIIVALSRTTKEDPARWEKLHQPFHTLFDTYDRYYPDEFLLRVGLNYCEATRDSELARKLVTRSVDKHCPSTNSEFTTSSLSSAIDSNPFLGGLTWDSEDENSNDEFVSTSQESNSFSPGESFLDAVESSTPADVKEIESKTMFGSSAADSAFGTSAKASEDESSPMFGRATTDSLFAENGGSTPDDIESTTTFSTFDKTIGLTFSSGSTASEGNEMDTATMFGSGAADSTFAVDEPDPPSTPPLSFKVFQKALKICLAADDLDSSREILDAYSRARDHYPKNVESDLWSFVLRGFASLGHKPDTIKDFLDTMKRKEMRISEESYGAVIHSLASGNCHEEASALFLDMKSDFSSGGGVEPGVSCYNALMFSHIKAKAWGQVLAAYEEMKQAGVMPNAATTQSLLIASYRDGGTGDARRQMEEILAMNVVVSRENCRLALKILMPDILQRNKNASVTDIQRHLRMLGGEEESASLRLARLNLLRSIRQADVEQKRVPTKNAPLEVLGRRREEAWRATLKGILDLEQTRRSEARKKKSMGLSSYA